VRKTQRSGSSSAERHAEKQVVKCGETHGEVGCHVRRETRRSGMSRAERHMEKRVVTCGKTDSETVSHVRRDMLGETNYCII